MAIQNQMQSNSNQNMNQQPMSKLLQINQGQFEDYLVMALNDSLMKKSKLHNYARH